MNLIKIKKEIYKDLVPITKNIEDELIGKSFKFENGIEVIKWSNGNYEGFDDNCDVDNEFTVTSEHIEAIEKMEKEELLISHPLLYSNFYSFLFTKT